MHPYNQLYRKCLILFNWLPPLTNIIARHAESAPYLSEKGKGGLGKKKPFMHTLLNSPPPVLLELANAIADDLYTFSLLGLLSSKSGNRAARFADWCWFLSTLANLVENTVERSILGNLEREGENLDPFFFSILELIWITIIFYSRIPHVRRDYEQRDDQD
jgi:hypothetical protein